jgi:hypothetical protein
LQCTFWNVHKGVVYHIFTWTIIKRLAGLSRFFMLVCKCGFDLYRC